MRLDFANRICEAMEITDKQFCEIFGYPRTTLETWFVRYGDMPIKEKERLVFMLAHHTGSNVYELCTKFNCGDVVQRIEDMRPLKKKFAAVKEWTGPLVPPPAPQPIDKNAWRDHAEAILNNIPIATGVKPAVQPLPGLKMQPTAIVPPTGAPTQKDGTPTIVPPKV